MEKSLAMKNVKTLLILSLFAINGLFAQTVFEQDAYFSNLNSFQFFNKDIASFIQIPEQWNDQQFHLRWNMRLYHEENWTAKMTITEEHLEGKIKYTIEYKDIAGNSGLTFENNVDDQFNVIDVSGPTASIKTLKSEWNHQEEKSNLLLKISANDNASGISGWFVGSQKAVSYTHLTLPTKA